MAKGAITRKQLLKEPDQFITFSSRLIAFGQSHSRPLMITAGCLLAAVLILVTINQISNRNENKASELVRQAVAKYSAALQDTDAKAAFERVKPDFSEIFDRFGSKDATKVARISFGNMSYAAGDADTAIAMYQDALKDIGQTASLKNIVLNGLGYAYVLKENYPEAIRYFEMLAEDDQKLMKDGALFNLALLYGATGNTERSKAYYEQLLAEFPAGMYKDLVKEKISG